MPMNCAEIDLLLAPDTEAPSVARRSLGEMQECLGAEQLEYARLLVTEVVTNCVLHAALRPEDEIRLWAAAFPGVVRVEVRDPGPGFEKPPSGGLSSLRPGVGAEHGRGLYLLERLSDRWGVDFEGSTRVWFEIGGDGGLREV